MPGVPSASGSGMWSRRRDEIMFDRLQKVPSRARCSGRRLGSIRVMGGSGVGRCSCPPCSFCDQAGCPSIVWLDFFYSLLVSSQKLREDGVSVTWLRELPAGFNDLEVSFLPSISEIKLKICWSKLFNLPCFYILNICSMWTCQKRTQVIIRSKIRVWLWLWSVEIYKWGNAFMMLWKQ